MAVNSPFGTQPKTSTEATGPLDQQLFVYKKPESQTAKEIVQPKERPSKSIKADITVIKSSLNFDFDLREEALYKASYQFSPNELEALEDLKLDLRRERDSKASKNDLIRIAVHMLVEDYREAGEKSYVIRKLRRRTPK